MNLLSKMLLIGVGLSIFLIPTISLTDNVGFRKEIKQQSNIPVTFEELHVKPTTKSVKLDIPNQELEKIYSFLAKRKNAYTKSFINHIYNACNKNIHSLRLIIAVSGSETNFGTVGSPKQGYTNNFWGWGYNSKTKKYFKGTEEQMAKSICKGFKKGGIYHNMITMNKGKYIVRADITKKYTGNDNAKTHSKNTLNFYKAML